VNKQKPGKKQEKYNSNKDPYDKILPSKTSNFSKITKENYRMEKKQTK